MVILMNNNKRLIYADDAKRAIEHYDPAFSYYIDNVPTADVAEVKYGHWIVGQDGSYMCSECGRVFRYEIGNYCSLCGARLKYEE